MRSFWGSAFLISLLLAGCAPSEPKTALETLRVEGRALKSEAGIRLSFPGSRIRLETVTNNINLEFELENKTPQIVFDIRVNGGAWQQQPMPMSGSFSYDLTVPGKVNRGFTLDILRRTEAWQGDLVLKTASSHGGFVDPDPFPNKKLLFIGDSITAGAGTTSRRNELGEGEAVSNARLAYPRILADRLNAQTHHIAYGGRGLTRDWQGIKETNNAPQFYDRILPDNPDYLWDPQNYQADIVSVMLGTNDFNPGIPDRESWTRTYQDFVTRIRNDYPNAQIFLVSSPMTGGEKGDALKTYVKAVAESFNSPTVQYLEVSQYYGEAWDAHPTTAEHEKIADELEPAFRQALGQKQN